MKNIFLTKLSIVVFMSLAIIGCDKLVDPGGLAPGEMQATSNVEGSFFAKDAVATDQGATYLVKASMASTTFSGNIVVTLQIPKGTVPYSVTVGTDANGIIDYCLEESPTKCTTFNAKKGSGSGTIKITALSPNLEGTFSGTLPSISGTGSRTITGGDFKAIF